MIKETRARLLPVTAIEWGPSTEDMIEAGRYLGENGFRFELVQKDPRRGVDVMPELVVYDWRELAQPVGYKQWILVYPGYRQLRVVDKETMLRETQDLAEEGLAEDIFREAETIDQGLYKHEAQELANRLLDSDAKHYQTKGTS